MPTCRFATDCYIVDQTITVGVTKLNVSGSDVDSVRNQMRKAPFVILVGYSRVLEPSNSALFMDVDVVVEPVAIQ